MKKITIVFFLFILHTSFSQKVKLSTALPNTVKKDLKIGLVLSGGGAKGFAHIGVLKVLDSIGVRIDYVGGTSAGAMIGAMYASGYHANEIDSIIRSYDFDELIQDKIPRAQFSLYQKEVSEKYALSLPLKNWKIGLPVALSKGQNFLNELTKITKHVHNIQDFTKLPIPFYCVATDIESGDKVVLESGFLPLAIKASGAFPSLFEPVEIDGRLLVDGGIVDNFPIDIMQEKEVDIIIGVDVQDNLGTRENLDSAPKIVMQIISFQMYEKSNENTLKTDVYIKPNITKYNVFSFDKAAELINEGVNNAKNEMVYLEALALQQHKTPKPNLNKKESKIYIDKINIKGHDNYTTNYVLSKLNLKNIDSISYQQFNECVKGLSATNNFKSIDYKFTLLKNKKTRIDFNLTENDISNSIQLSAHYDDLYKTGVLVNFTSKHALTNNDIFSFDAVFGDNLRYNLDYIVDNGFTWQFGIKSRYNSFKKNFIIDNQNILSIFSNKQLLKYTDFSNQVYIQSKFKEKLGLKLGGELKNISVYTENDITNHKDFFDKRTYFDVFGEIILDTYDAKYFTKKGVFFNAKYNLYLAASNFNNTTFNPFSQLKISAGYTDTFFNKFTAQISSNIGLTIGENEKVFNYFLGGNNKNFINNFESFYGYNVANLNNNAFIKATGKISYEFISKHHLSFLANVASINKDVFVSGSVFDELKTGYGVGYGIKSILGPIELKYTWTPDNNLDYWNFNIGFWF